MDFQSLTLVKLQLVLRYDNLTCIDDMVPLTEQALLDMVRQLLIFVTV